ncbi:MAG: hypothetical protein F9K47_11875 [Burkholderiales bacterium]|nr:MAG: hypothetical protein F9K47_11875 [Burkholderiales bacterium]
MTINPRYWGEKLQAIDKSGGYREWCREKFVTRIQEDFAEYLADREPENVQEIGERFHTDVLDCLENAGKETAYQAAMSFEVDGQCPFQDWWEVDTDEYTYHFLWCCYAIVWGIQQYDQSRAIIVDNFAGSGAWLGIEWALGDFVTAIGATATLGVFMLSKDPAVIAALHSMSPWVGQNVEVLSWLVMGLLMTAFVTAPFVLNDRDWQVGESQLARVGWIGLIVVRVLAFLVALVAILGMLGLLFRSLTQ